MGESIHTPDINLTLPVDDDLFDLYRKIGFEPFEHFIGLVVEVKGNVQVEEPSAEHVAYAERFFGNAVHLFRMAFSQRYRNINFTNDLIEVPILHALHWCLYRFRWMNYKDILSKSGSWNWSEDFLSDLLYLQQVDFALLDNEASKPFLEE